MKHTLARVIFIFFAMYMGLFPGAVAYAQTIDLSVQNNTSEIVKKDTRSYRELMLDFAKLEESTQKLTEEERTKKQTALAAELQQFITEQKEQVKKLGLDSDKQRTFIDLLESQLQQIDPKDPGVIDGITSLFATKEQKKVQDEHAFKIPESPARFSFGSDEIEIKSLQNPVVFGNSQDRLIKDLQGLVTVKSAVVDEVMPVIGDVQEDGGEIQFGLGIRQLAGELQNNPLNIYNFVSNEITYEPYYGAKKGALGCLAEKVCNDTDAASLTIALLRAAGIPARYKKSIAVLTAKQLQEMLGVEQTIEGRRTVFGMLAKGGVPIYSISNNGLGSQQFLEVDFSSEEEFAVEWTFVEAFIEYDERGGDVANVIDVSEAENTTELRALLTNDSLQWVPIDVIVKPYERVVRPVVPDDVSFDTEAFWFSYLQYQGALNPLEKFSADVHAASGIDITESDRLSVREPINRERKILPSRTPYVLGAGSGDGISITPESWTVLPNERRHEVTIRLIREDDSIAFSHTAYGSEINNMPMTLYYQGTTETDRQTIDSFGGLHETPPSLVDISPIIEIERAPTFEQIEGNTSVLIGESLELEFIYARNGEEFYRDEKFSNAGNTEGIFISLSHVADNDEFDNEDDEYFSSKIFAEGNSAIAREYLRMIQKHGELLEGVFDYDYTSNFSRAVVTQNRILSEVNGTPTTFEFSGLTIDATTYINDQSKRGYLQDNRDDFRLLWGLQASHFEADLFERYAGLESIATIQGIQYAYANPGEYTVHIIDENNQSVVDTLQLSANTKQNMRDDIALGNTIITPNKPISQGEFQGILYISLDPERTGTYAIGEQAQQNGGFSVASMQVRSYQSEEGTIQILYEFASDLGDKVYAYQEGETIDGEVSCTLTLTQFFEITSRSDWDSAYGFPCVKVERDYFGYEHVFIVTSNAAKFYSPNRYNVWITREKANQVIQNARYAQNDTGLEYIAFNGRFKFNFTAGTFSRYGYYIKPDNGVSPQEKIYKNTITAYLKPTNFGGESYSVYGEMLNQLAQKNNTDLTRLGFPLSNRRIAADSDGRHGEYQEFVGGQMYRSWKSYLSGPILGFDSVHATYNQIKDEYNRQGGSGGELGFPMTETEFSNGSMFQVFEDDQQIRHYFSTGETVVKKFRGYDCEDYGDIGYHQLIKLNYIRAKGALDQLADSGEEVVDLLGSVSEALQDPSAAIEEVKAIANEIDLIFQQDQVLAVLGEIIGSAGDGIIEEIKQARCPARVRYLEGRLVVVAAEFILTGGAGRGSLKLSTKLGKIRVLLSKKINSTISKVTKVTRRIDIDLPKFKNIQYLDEFGLGRKVTLKNQDDIDELIRIRNIANSNQKGSEGRDFVESIYDHLTLISEEAAPNYSHPQFGGRNWDLYDSSTKTSIEVKTRKNTVSFSGKDKEQVIKDVELLSIQGVKPIWVFTEAPPSSTFVKFFKENGIEYIVIDF